MYKIYCLIDPFTNIPFYVGATGKELRKRMYSHMGMFYSWERIRRIRPNWTEGKIIFERMLIFYKCWQAGKEPIISLLANVLPTEVDEMELYYYNYYTELGIKLHQSKFLFNYTKHKKNKIEPIKPRSAKATKGSGRPKIIAPKTLVDANSVTKGVAGRPKKAEKEKI